MIKARPTKRYVNIDNGECDGEESVDRNYDDVKEIHRKCAGFHQARWERYDMCMRTKTYIQKNPEADDTAMRKDWIDTKQEKFIKAYALLDTFLTIVINWMGNFEEAKAEIQRKLTFKTVKTVKLSLGFGEGDEIDVSTPYGSCTTGTKGCWTKPSECAGKLKSGFRPRNTRSMTRSG